MICEAKSKNPEEWKPLRWSISPPESCTLRFLKLYAETTTCKSEADQL